jgi:hypothetical protein
VHHHQRTSRIESIGNAYHQLINKEGKHLQENIREGEEEPKVADLGRGLIWDYLLEIRVLFHRVGRVLLEEKQVKKRRGR